MVKITASLVTLALSLFADGVFAHPGHHGTTEMKSRAEYMANAKRTSLAHCADVLKARGTMDKVIERRQSKLDRIREKRGIKKSRKTTMLEHCTAADSILPQGPFSRLVTSTRS
ncbi:hypothetical protein MPH_06774 [Macrophomina phaseolina MS6]|uniref:Uncharacterized protein n=1 Tax=Macrophomina phaseolina (strain MS6) TaxID=1126212 RepID=K2S0R3_MACPH|nr:hypothetical protein MPH_06774 [Macrophomina phaseolina MS6]